MKKSPLLAWATDGFFAIRAWNTKKRSMNNESLHIQRKSLTNN